MALHIHNKSHARKRLMMHSTCVRSDNEIAERVLENEAITAMTGALVSLLLHDDLRVQVCCVTASCHWECTYECIHIYIYIYKYVNKDIYIYTYKHVHMNIITTGWRRPIRRL